ncbi:diaminopropionate ammonia-lyase [Agromyces sp. NPDC055520]
MHSPTRPWFTHPEARAWRNEPISDDVLAFHRSIPAYTETPLVEDPALAEELGVGRVFVKDESSRMELPAFKILGASYAVSRALSSRYGSPDVALSLPELADRATRDPSLGLTAATDGNHGRAVAHVARLLGVRATVFYPAGLTDAAKQAIADEGATTVELDLPYDDVVAEMARVAAAKGADEIVIQDTAWPGYVDVPQWIVDGYSTLFREVDHQLAAAGVGSDGPDLVAVPVGVGSFAQAAVRHYRSDVAAPVVLSVESENAPAIIESLRNGAPTTVATRHTIMSGLNCGTPSSLAWPYLARGVDAATTVTELEATIAVHDLERHGIDAGPCGAATLAGVRIALSTPERRDELGLDEASVLVLFSTEGRAANPLPAEAGDAEGGDAP